MRKLFCLIFGHRWSEFYYGAFGAKEGYERRKCWTCSATADRYNPPYR